MIISVPPAECNIALVQDLLEEQGRSWKQELVEELFSPHEARQILHIPISHSGNGDQLIWQPKKHGMYTVKSAYRVVQTQKEGQHAVAETSVATVGRRNMWRHIWKLPVKPKVRHFFMEMHA